MYVDVMDYVKATSLAVLAFFSLGLVWTPFGGFVYGGPLAVIALGLSLFFRRRRRERARGARAIALVGLVLSALALGGFALFLIDALTGKARGLV
jgi:predicted PurR-regulated permease PerM